MEACWCAFIGFFHGTNSRLPGRSRPRIQKDRRNRKPSPHLDFSLAAERFYPARPGTSMFPVSAAAQAVHKQVGDLNQWPNWLPFTKDDKTVQVTIDKPTGVGASQHWTGNRGKGKLTFTASDEDKGIEYDMVMDDKWTSKGTISYAKSGDETRVTWRMTGQNDDFLGKWMAVAMPHMVGPMFEEGLADLKAKVEAN